MTTAAQYTSFPQQLGSVRVVSTTNVSGTYNNGLSGVGATFTIAASSLTVDSVSLHVGDSVLLQNQTTVGENGIYQVTSISSTVVLTRRTDLQCIEQVSTGLYVYVSAGTTNAGACFVIVEPLPEFFGFNELRFTASPLNTGFGTAAEKDASDDALDIVASVSGSTVLNQIPVAADTAGTIKTSTGVTATTGGGFQANGNISAGTSGTAGTLSSFSSTAARGALVVQATANTGNTNVVVTNAAHGQATTYTISDVGEAAATLLGCKLDSADPNGNFFSFDVTCGQAALAAGGSVTLVTSGGSKQYKIRKLYLNSGGTNFSGGGGDRLGQVTDGTTVYSVVPAASLQTLANAQWGATALPNPASAAINTSTAAGANLTFKYSGGTTDYTAGSVVISGVVERIA